MRGVQVLPGRLPRGIGLVLPGLRLLQHGGGGPERGGGHLGEPGGQHGGLLRGGVERIGQGLGARGGEGRRRRRHPGGGRRAARGERPWRLASAARAAAARDLARGDVAPAGAAGRGVAGRVGDRHRVVVAVGVQVVRHRGLAALRPGVGVHAGERAGSRLVEPGAHADLPALRVGPLPLVADLDRRARCCRAPGPTGCTWWTRSGSCRTR